MKFSDFEALWKKIKHNPVKVLLYILVSVVVGGVIMWAGGFLSEIGKQQAQVQPTGEDAALEIVDLAVEKPRSLHPVLDLKLLNTGGGTAFLTEIAAEVLERVPFLGFVEPSGRYDLLIDSDVNVIRVSHDIRSNDVERIRLTLGAARHNLSCSFKLQLRLTYNGDQTVLSRPFEVTFVEEDYVQY